jgi:hypothetical protein
VTILFSSTFKSSSSGSREGPRSSTDLVRLSERYDVPLTTMSSYMDPISEQEVESRMTTTSCLAICNSHLSSPQSTQEPFPPRTAPPYCHGSGSRQDGCCTKLTAYPLPRPVNTIRGTHRTRSPDTCTPGEPARSSSD